MRVCGYEVFTKIIDVLRIMEKPLLGSYNKEFIYPKEESKEEIINEEESEEESKIEEAHQNNSFFNIINLNSEEFKNMEDNYKAFKTACYPLVSAITSLTSPILNKNLTEIEGLKKEKKDNNLAILACLSATVDSHKDIHSK